MNIAIDHARAGDIDAMCELLNILFSIEQDFVPDELAQRRGLGLLLARPQHGQLFVARHAVDGVVAMVSAQLLISTAVGAPSALIEDLVVRAPYRGQGIGQALLDAAKTWAVSQGARRLQLLADADNAPALDFYRKLDWQPTRLFAWKKQLT